MTEISGFDPAQFAALESVLADFASESWIGKAFEKAAPLLDKYAIDRFIQIAEGTPFSPFSIGRKRPSGSRITSSSKFGIDTGAFFRDWTKEPEFNGLIATRSTSLPYTENLQDLFEQKSPFDDGLLGVSEVTLDLTLEAIAQEFETLWKN
jgi:hypothetical protein